MCESCAEVPECLQSKLELDRSKVNELQTELNNRNIVIEKLEKDLEDSNKVSLSTEQACKTLRKLANDKDEIINQQKAIIDSCKYNAIEQNGELSYLRSQLCAVNDIVSTRNLQINEFKNELANLKEKC